MDVRRIYCTSGNNYVIYIRIKLYSIIQSPFTKLKNTNKNVKKKKHVLFWSRLVVAFSLTVLSVAKQLRPDFKAAYQH